MGGVVKRTRYFLSNRRATLARLGEVLRCSQETEQWLPLTLDYAGLRPIAYPYELRLRSNEKVTLREHIDTVIFWMIFVRRHYPVSASDRVILDLGANIGMFTLYAAREAPQARIIAVEPFPTTYARLGELIERNRLQSRVTAINCAVAGKAGTRTMDSAEEIPSQYRRIYSPQTVTLNADHRGPSGAQQDDYGVPVKTETLASLLELAGLASVDLLKMNIHGNEYDVLLSTEPGVLQRFRQIVVQYHELPAEMNLGKEQIIENLQRLGFSLVADNDTHRGSGLAVFAA
jgi:FkbM family methyltransferase